MSKYSKVQVTLEYAAARGLLAALGSMPRPVAVAAGRRLGRLVYAFVGGFRRTGERNLALAFPEMSARERARLLIGSFDSLGRQLGEFSQFARRTPDFFRRFVEYDGMEHILEAQARGRGIIFLASHLGAWELLSFAHSAYGYPLSFFVRRIDNPLIEKLVEQTRTRFGNETIDKKDAVRAALRVLREGKSLGILADLNTHPHEGIFVPFFGRLACTTTSVAVLALRTDAAVLPCCAVWSAARRKFVIRIDPALEIVRTGAREHDIETNTARFAAAIERQIKAYPDQWLWIHKRWKTRPAGEPDIYDEQRKMAPSPVSPALRTEKDTFEI